MASMHWVGAALAVAVSLSTIAARSAPVEVNFTGEVTRSDNPIVQVGDTLSWTFTFEPQDLGNCRAAGDFSFSCTDAVLSASAQIGDIVLESLAPIPEWGRTSLLNVSNGIEGFPVDVFQGSMSFGSVAGIEAPILAFYLYDSGATAFSTDPRLPTSWNAESLKRFDTLEFRLFEGVYGVAVQLGEGTIAGGRPYIPPVPEPAAAGLWALGLAALGLGFSFGRPTFIKELPCKN